MDSKHLIKRKSLKLLRSNLGNKSTSVESVIWNQLKSKVLEERKFIRQQSINHPGRESRIVNISKSAVPATPPSKGGETYVSANPIIKVVFVNKIFPELPVLGQWVGFY